MAGPHVLFLLTVPRAPRVSLTLTSLLPRKPPPVPSLRHHAPTRRRCSTRSAPAPPHRRRTRIAPPRPCLARSAPAPPAPCPLRACAACSTPSPRRRSSPSPTDSLTRVAPPAPLLWSFHRDSSPDLSSLHFWFKRAQGVRAFAPKGFSSIFVEFSSLILQGMIFTLPWHVSCFPFHIFHT